MKRMICMTLACLLALGLFGCSVVVDCEHDYQLIDQKASTCTELGFDLYQCKHCREIYKENRIGYGAHAYEDEHPCHERACQTVGCTHKEQATAQHQYTQEYICKVCKETKLCTLEILARDFEEQMFAQSRINAGTMTGSFEVVILNAADTLFHIENYITDTNLDHESILGGLFVKFDVTNGGNETLFTIYYNFGLEFSEAQTQDVAFSYNGSNEIWYLEVVEGNPLLLFEYSIV